MKDTIQSRRRSARAAFTLIELLVVIAIIAILAAIMVPLVSSGIARGQEAACRNNLHSCAIALTVITDGFKPYPLAEQNYYDKQGPLIAALSPHIGGASNVLFCPRSVKVEGLNISAELQAGRIGYFYWGFVSPGGGVGALRPGDSTNVWITQGWNQSLGMLVLMTDHFREKGAWAQASDWQYHAGASVEQPLSVVGTLAVLEDGSVQKLAPRP